MVNYYVKKAPEGDGTHEVHSFRCIFLPRAKSECIALGSFERCAEAVEAARVHFETASGCFFCIHDYHLNKGAEPLKSNYEIPGKS